MPASTARHYTVKEWQNLNEEKARARLAQRELGQEERETRLKTIGAYSLGAIPDWTQMGLDVLSHVLVAQRVDVPYTSDEWIEAFGGDSEDWMAPFLAPEPGKVVTGTGKALKGMFLGAVAAKELGFSGAIQTAKKLLNNGTNKNDIKRATGVVFGADGEARFFYPMNKIEYDFSAFDTNYHTRALAASGTDTDGWATVRVPLTSVAKGEDFDTLVKAYPELKGVKVARHARVKDGKLQWRVYDREDGIVGWYDKGLQEIGTTVPQDKADLLNRNMAHEIQHVIQKLEGFQGGSNRLIFDDEVTRYLQADLMDLVNRNPDEAKSILQGARANYIKYVRRRTGDEPAKSYAEYLADELGLVIKGDENYQKDFVNKLDNIIRAFANGDDQLARLEAQQLAENAPLYEDAVRAMIASVIDEDETDWIWSANTNDLMWVLRNDEVGMADWSEKWYRTSAGEVEARVSGNYWGMTREQFDAMSADEVQALEDVARETQRVTETREDVYLQ